jgi:hypothetical protein
MRRLSLQLLAVSLAWSAVNLVASADAFPPYLLRDAGILALLAAALFAWWSNGWHPTPILRRVTTLSSLGRVLWLTGLVCLVAGGIGLRVMPDGILRLTATLLWMMGAGLAIIGVWWPGASYAYAPPSYRWEQDARGRFLRVTPEGRKLPPTFDLQAGGWRGVLLVLLVGVVLRFGDVGRLPSGCIDRECVDALRLVEGQALTASTPDALNLYERLAQYLLQFTGDGLISLRLAAAAFGAGSLLAFAGVARRLAPPLVAAPALLLLALNPWHLHAARISDAWLAPMCLATVALWLTLQALAHADVRWWTLAGLALGLFWVEAGVLRLAVLLWSIAVLGLALLPDGAENRGRLSLAAVVSAVAGLVGVAAPAWLHGGGGEMFTAASSDLWSQIEALSGALLRPEAAPGSVSGDGLLPPLVVAFIVVGAGACVRHARRPAALAIGVGAVLFTAALARVDFAATPLRSLLLPTLPFWLAVSVVALERMVDALVMAWGRVIRPVRLTTATATLLALFLGVAVVRMGGELIAMQHGSTASTPTEIARYIAGRLAGGDAQTTFVVPASVLQHPSLRLLVGDAVNAGRVQMLDFGTTLPYAALPPGDVVYLVPAGQNQVLEQVLLAYPAAEVADSTLENAWSPSAQRRSFILATVSREAVLKSQALHLRLDRGEPSETGDAELEAFVATTALDWQAHPPAPPPFTARLAASLSLAQAGAVEFAMEVGGSAAASMRIDAQLVLDTQLGVSQRSIPLAQGVHTLEIDYRSGDLPGDLALFWRPPGVQERSPLPTNVLHAPALPEAGLLGEYWSGEYWSDDPGGMMLTQRLDRILGFDFGLQPPYNVLWQGKLGIARAGEYLLAALASGPHQIWIDDRLVVDGLRADATDDATNVENAYNEGLIYLERGWHDLSIRYRPSGTSPDFRLLWQPPGANPGELTSAYLAPVTGERTLADQPPTAPPLLDPQLGDDAFALLRLVSALQPGVRIPPQNLEPLPLEVLWSAGAGCGSGENQLNTPNGLAFAPNGQLYVADTGNGRIQVLDLDGGFHSFLTDAALEEPVDVAFAPDGALLVLDAVASPIFRLNADGALTPLPVQTSFYRPRGFDVAADGTIAVADTGGGRVVVMSEEGSLLAQYGGPDTLLARGQPVDTLRTPRGLWAIAAEDGRLWNVELDAGLTAIQPTATMNGPKMAPWPNGGFLITDPAQRTFTAFAATGQPLQQFHYVDQLLWPSGIAVFQAGEQLFLAASDARACTVTLYRYR